MAVTIEIRVMIPVIGGNRQELVRPPYPDWALRQARMDYEELVAEYPNWCFELVQVTKSEECLVFTKRDLASPAGSGDGC
jgi:hypothetical protein